MHFRFNFDPRFTHEFTGSRSGRGARWAAFARAFTDEFGGNWGDGPGGPGDRSRGGPRRQRFGAEALKYLLLHLLKEEPRHGYDLIKAIEGMSAGLYSPSPGMIYPTLTLLADQGLIEELPAEESRRRYGITDAGRAALEDAKTQVSDVLSRLAELAGAVRDDETQPLRRAFRNLKSAAGTRMSSDGADRDLALKIAEILDEAAQRIERL
jgi:DNA-binding PadR family transcriptional regulator